MAEEIITILNVHTGEAVKSVGELKDNIKLLKDELTKAEVGTEEYQVTAASSTEYAISDPSAL